jgi:curved DNA-binding protein CbpA
MASTSDAPSRAYLAAAFDYFGLAPSATRAEFNARFRKLALQHHPDKGGVHEEFVKMMDFTVAIE